jgi:hypothetical protein
VGEVVVRSRCGGEQWVGGQWLGGWTVVGWVVGCVVELETLEHFFDDSISIEGARKLGAVQDLGGVGG